MHPFREFRAVLFDPLPVLRSTDPVAAAIGAIQGIEILVEHCSN
jgi:hypothetical protein